MGAFLCTFDEIGSPVPEGETELPEEAFGTPPAAASRSTFKEAAAKRRSHSALNVVEVDEDELPDGWGVAKDAKGRTYYYHRKTNHSQWTPPTAADVRARREKDPDSNSPRESLADDEVVTAPISLSPRSNSGGPIHVAIAEKVGVIEDDEEVEEETKFRPPPRSDSMTPAKSALRSGQTRELTSVYMPVKPALKSANMALASTSSTASTATRKSVQVTDRTSLQAINIRSSEKQEKGITSASGRQVMKRTRTYAALGLGYIVRPYAQDEETNSRGSIKRVSVVAEGDDGTDGMRFSELYKLGEELAKGGLGAVHKAIPKNGSQAVVAKVVQLSTLEPVRGYDVFRTETSFFAPIEHPNVLWRRQLFQEDDSYIFVMDLLTGPSLFDRVATEGVLTRRQTCRYLFEMLSALAYLHDNGIMHRDVKPENFMLDNRRPDATLKLIDFAVSRLFNKGDIQRTFIGTLVYCAPEVLDGCYNEKCDVWSCGAAIFLCCCGSPPMTAYSDDQLIAAIHEGRVAWYLVSFSDERLLSVMEATLTKDTERRPHAIELANNEWLRSAAYSPPSCCGLLG